MDSNRLLQGAARVYDYDLAGNPLSDGRYSYTYDSQGRLTEVRQGATVRQRNSYNALGQRVRKETAGGSETAPTITHALYSTEGQLLAELDSSGNTLREYLYLQSWPVAVVDYPTPVAPAAAGDELTTDSVEEYPEAAESPSVDNPASAEKPVATTRPPASVDGRAVTAPPAGVLTYLHPDHLGTPRLATDSAKRVVWRWDSAPFGDTLPVADPDGDGLPFTLNLRFPGQYFDAETGLHYNYFRDYDPVTGRYLESDPIGLQGGVGTYGYADNNGVSIADPYGLLSFVFGRPMPIPEPVIVPRPVPTPPLLRPVPTPVGGPKPKPTPTPETGPKPAPTLDPAGPISHPNKEECKDDEKDCTKANKWHLSQAEILSEHKFKEDIVGKKNGSQYDICACKDGSLVLREVGMCSVSGPTIPTGASWKNK